MSFIKVILEELEDAIEAKIRYNAIAHRLSKLDTEEFSKYMKQDEEKTGTSKEIEVDHEAQLKQFKQG